MLPCANCRSMDFREEHSSGSVICMGCGLVQSEILFLDYGYQESYDVAGGFDVNTARTAFSREAVRTVHKNTQSLPYKRQTYFNERLSQWQCNEPRIPEEDMAAIKQLWDSYAKVAWPDTWAHKPPKERIGAVLTTLDSDLVKDGHRPRFVRVYYEKWLTIRAALTGYRSWGEYASPRLIHALQRDFDRLQSSYDVRYRERFKRHSMISYNFIIRRLLELRGCHHMIEDFPPLKTTAKQKLLTRVWRDVCADLGWPYVNHDHIVFPDMVK